MRLKAQPDVISGPASGFVTQHRLKALDGFGDRVLPFTWRQPVEQGLSEQFQPSGHVGWKRGWPRNQLYVIDAESGRLKPGAIIVYRREIPWDAGGCAGYASPFKRRDDRHDNRGDASMPAHFGDKAPARLERALDAGNYRVRRGFHPMERGVRENRVEFAGERQLFAGAYASVEPARLRRRDHLRRRVDAHDGSACRGDLFGQNAVAAAEVKDAFTRPGRQKFEYRRAKGRHKMRVPGVIVGLPFLFRRFTRFHRKLLRRR